MQQAHLNRRNMLTGTVAAITGTTAALASGGAIATVTPTNENERELSGFLSDLRKAIADQAAAIEAKDWKVAEYAHLWPLAPEEILAVPFYGQPGDLPSETNLAGEPIYRRNGDLPVRMSRGFLSWKENEMRHWSLDTVETLRQGIERVKEWRVRSPSGREKVRRRVAEHEAAIPVAAEYEAETARLRKVSGIADIHAAREAAEKRMKATVKAMFAIRATTPLGAAMKAEALRQWSAAMGFSDDRLVRAAYTATYAQEIVDDLLAMSLIEGEA